MRKLLQIAATAAIIGGVLLVAPSTTQAKSSFYDLYVSQNAVGYTNGDGGTGCKQADFSSIQSALNYAWEGGTIYVCAGTYYENLEVYDWYVSITGAGPAKTVLNGGWNGDNAIDTNGHQIAVSDMRITNGAAANGGAIYTDNADLWCFNTILDYNLAVYGGAIWTGAGDTYLNKCRLNGNYAHNTAGAIYANEVHAFNSTFFDNSAWFTGGAIGAYGWVDAEKSNFIGNYTYAGNGGAVYSNLGNVDLVGGSFVNNSANGDGGAVYVNNGGDLYATGTLFKDNKAASVGAAIDARRAYLTKVTFSGNSYLDGTFGIWTVYQYFGCGTERGVRWGSGQSNNC